MLRTLIIAFTLAAAASIAEAQTTITLHPSARISEDAQDVRLADIADISPLDDALGTTVILDSVPRDARKGWTTVSVAAVRAALDARGVNWGRTSLRGGCCTLRVAEPRLAASPTPPGAQHLPHPTITPAPLDLSGPPTLKTVTAARLASFYGVTPDRLRLAFDPADSEVLAAPVAGRLVDVALGGVSSSSRLPVTVTLYDGETVVLSRSFQIDVLIYRPVLTAAGPIERGRTITDDQVNSIEQWLAPSSKSVPTADQVIGAVAQQRIKAGEVIDASDIAPALACKRGDTVYVHCLSGSVVVKMKARALAQARDGDLVQLKTDSSDQPFTARMSGRGRAVLTVSPDTQLDRPAAPAHKGADR